MSEQEPPRVDDVWRHNETKEIREVVAVDFASITFDTASGLTRKVTTHFDWRGWKRNATRLSPDPPVDVAALEPAEVFDWKQALAGVEVFGPWQRYDWPGMLHCWKRKLPARDDGAFSWLGVDGNYLFSIPPFGGDRGMGSPKEGFPTLSAAQAACDALLRERGVLLVD